MRAFGPERAMKQSWFGFLISLCLGAAPLAAQGVGLVVIGGNFQAVAPNSQFGIAVQLVAPSPGGVEIGLLGVVTSGPSVDCAPGVTDTNGVVGLTCQVGSWPIETVVHLTVGDTAHTVTTDFFITVRPPYLLEGLTKLQGDQAFVVRGDNFDLTVQAVRANQPEQGLRFTITRSPSELPVSCPELAIADSIGQARITCSVLDILPANATLLVTFRDGIGRTVTFTVYLLAQDELEDGIFKVSGDDQAVPVGRTLAFPLVAVVIANGRPASGTELIVEVSDPQLLICPQRVGADAAGRVSIVCSSGPIRGNGFAAVHLRDGVGRALLEPFRVSVISSGTGSASSLELGSTTTIRGKVGDVLQDSIVVRARDGSGRPAAGVAIFPSADLNVSFSPSVAVTGFNGEAVFDTTLGCPGGTGLIRLGPLPGTTSLAVNVNISTGGAELLNKLQGDGQAGAPGEKLSNVALVVGVTNRCLQGVRRETVNWTVNPPDAATLENVISTTDNRGRSSVIVRLGQRPGPFTVTAKHLSRTQTFNLVVAPKPAGVGAVSEQRVTLPRNTTSQPLTVQVVSDKGVGVPGAGVQFAIVEGLGALTESFVPTGADGKASTRFVAPGTFGTTRVRATVDASAAALAGVTLLKGQEAFTVDFLLITGGRRPDILPPGGFVNGASFRSGWTPGGLGSIFGVGLMEDISGVVAPNGPSYATTLRGVSVTINGFAAPILALANVAGREQINLQVPFEVRPGNATVVVSNNGTEAKYENVPVFPSQPGIFEVSIQGGLYAAALHADYRLVAPSDPARPGETILLFVTGMGAVQPSVATNQPGPTPAPKTVLDPIVGIDDAGVADFGAYYAPNFLTLYQINFRLPDDITTGNHRVSVGAGGAFSQTAVLPVRR
jgi:uncharacterized protein (TIGR03437 family)